MRRIAAGLFVWLLLASAAHADVVRMVRPGGVGFADVVRVGSEFALVYSNDRTVTAETPTRVLWSTPLPEQVLYTQAAACGHEVRAVAQGRDTGQALEFRAGGVRAFGPSFGQNATTIACINNRFVAFTQFSGTQYSVSDLDTMTTEVRTWPSTSQGFRDVLDTGEVRTGDAWFQRTIRGQPIHQPVERDGIWAGQNSLGLGIKAIVPDRAFTVIPGAGFEPQIARAGDTFAVSARTPSGATLAIVTPPYPPNEPVVIHLPPAEICGDGLDNDVDGLIDEGCAPPVAEPTPQNDLTPEQLAHLLRNQVDVIAGVKKDYPHLQGPDLLDQAVHRLNALNNTDRFGRKARDADGGRLNDDAITIRLKDSDRGQKKIIDALGNANPHPDPSQPADVPQWHVIPANEEPGNGYWAPAVRPNLDGGTVPAPEPQPDPEVPELRARVRELEAQVAHQADNLRLMQQLRVEDAATLNAIAGERDRLQTELTRVRAEAPFGWSCESKVPAVLKGFGVKVGCRVFPTPPPVQP